MNKRDELSMLIADDKPDIIFISEVIPKNQINPITQALLEIDDYKCLLNFDPELTNLGSSGIRGVAIYSRTTLKTAEIEFIIDGFHDHVWLDIQIDDKKTILCGCIYRSPSNDTNKNGSLESTKAITQLITKAYESNANLLIAGDFNYKDIDWNNEFATREKLHLTHFLNTLYECFLIQHVSEPTRYRDGEKPNLLDLIISGDESMVQDLTYHPPLGESDHICLRFIVPLNAHQVDMTPSHNIYKGNYEKMKNDLRQYDWKDLLCNSFEKDYDVFFNILQHTLEKNTPLSRKATDKKNIYMTNEALRMKNKKCRLWKRYLTTRARYDRVNYVQCKNDLRDLTRRLRYKFEQDLANKVKEKPKLFWKYAKSRLKSKSLVPSLTKPNGIKAIESEDKAETLNNFFASVFTTEDLLNIPDLPSRNVDDVLSHIDISPEIVRIKLENLNSNKSPGHDNWHPHALKELAGVISVPLSLLFQKSLYEGAHKSWLKAVITPIFKKGLKCDPGNYRPISITSVISKVMESIVRHEIVTHLVNQKILSDEQHGFVPGRDCKSLV